jgi:filamentous hemagglutinin family protein
MNLCNRSNAIRAASRRPQALAALCGFVLAGGVAFANPMGPQIVAGQVTIVGSGNQLLITNSPGAIINWQSFSIGAGQLTQFIQQSSSSSVLNRITGQNPSQIFGALQSNGKVFLINPNGVLFGAGSQVNVNGLVASSLNLSNADFLAGKLDFSGLGKAGNVTNRGAITTPSGGQVFLIAPNVTNDGIITSPEGDVMLAAGQSVDLADSTDPDMRVVISAPGNQALNVGGVVAESGRIGIYGALVNQMGLVSADSAVAGENGKIVFKSSGTTTLGTGSVTTADGAGVGGDIQVPGNRVALTGNATFDASGRTGGGTVLIGGDTHGSNPDVQNAALTYMGPMARIMADALQSGDGGKVVVWSDQQTQMYGNIFARGGAQGGNGGSVEASSAGVLDFEGAVDLRAPAGKAGNLLLDPTDITIESGSSTGDITVAGSGPFVITGSNPTSVLSTAELQNQLGLGNVTVSTASSASAPLGGTITVASPVAWGNANSLTLAATQDININAPINAPAATLVLTAAGGSITQAINMSTPAAITVAALAASAPNGSVTLNEPTNNVTGAIAGVGSQGFTFADSGAITVGTVGSISGISSSGNVALQAASGIAINSAITVPTAGGTIALQTSSGDITEDPELGQITAASVSAVASNGSVELTNGTNAVGTIAGSANGDLGFSLVNNNSFTVGTVPAVGNISSASGITASNGLGYSVVLQTPSAGDITLGAAVNAGSSTVLVDAAGAVVQGTGGLITAGTLNLDAGSAAGIGSSGAPLLANAGTLFNVNSQGPVYLSNSGILTIDWISAVGAVNVNSGGSLTIPAAGTCDCPLSISGASVTLTAYGPMLLNTGTTVTAAGPVALYAGYDVANNTYVGSPNTLTLNGSVTGSTVGLSAGGAINVTGAVTGAVTQMPSLYSPTTLPPTLTQCIADPMLPGCSSVLPTLAQCTAAPTTAGCSVVLPTLAQCEASPAAPGCAVVLPTLAQCEASPAAAGCTVVLPTLAQCEANPSVAGCATGVAAIQAQATPTILASDSYIIALNTESSTLLNGGTPGSGPNASTGSNSSAGNAGTTNTGATNNDTAKKLYCN